MIGRIALALVAAGVASASWPTRPYAPTPTVTLPMEVAVFPLPADSIYADVLPRDNPLIPVLDAAYRELEAAMLPHGCMGCHAPDLTTGDRRAQIRHAARLLDSRRAIALMVEADLMPPETDDHGAGIGDPVARTELLRRAKVFRAIGDAAVASW